MARLQIERVDWLTDLDKIQLREITDKVTRYVEDLDSIKDRASVAHEELASRLSEILNNRMYILSVVGGLFLPLGFLTGLLGINVGGIPWADNPLGFSIVLLGVFIIILGQFLFFKMKNWF
jgi:zinc transporter